MQKYDSYKESGIEWIGEIPQSWDYLKVRNAFYLKGRIGWQGLKADEFTDKGPFLVTGTDFENGKVNWNTCYHISQERFDEAPEIHVENGDVLITKDGTVGKMAYVDNKPDKVSLNSHLLIIRPIRKDICNKYVFWAFQTSSFTYYKGLAQTGSIMESLSQEKIGSYVIPFPPYTEQKRIANYLDYKCTKVDNLISSQQKRIELLKELKQSIISRAVTRGINPYIRMKDSGIEWIGAVPEHWEVKKIKHICRSEKYSIKTGPFGTQLKGDDLQPTGDVCVYNQRNVIDDNFSQVSFYVTNEKATSLDSFYTKPQDLLVTSRGTIGRCAILPNNVPMGILHPCLIALRIDETQCDLRWLRLFINDSDIFSTNIFLNSNATTIEVIYTDTIKNVFIPLPTIQEQSEILDVIEKKLLSLDVSISNAMHQIDLLKEYKQSLITEVVTGKRKVI